MKSKTMFGTVMLLLAALFWGCSFTVQSVGMEYVGPYTLQAVRMLLGSAVLAPFVWLRAKNRRKTGNLPTPNEKKRAWQGGLCCGAVLTVAANLQQVGIQVMMQEMQPNVAGKSAFITALYVLLVPLMSLLMGRKVEKKVLFAAAMGAVGLYFLCMNGDSLALGTGDMIVLLCAFGFAAHIMVIDHFSDVDGVLLSCLQFLIAGAISAVIMFALEQPTVAAVLSCWMPILYMAVFSCGVAYTFQIIGQKYVPPTAASLLMCMESVFSVICGMLVLKEVPSAREALGCAIMMTAIVLCQLPGRKKV